MISCLMLYIVFIASTGYAVREAERHQVVVIGAGASGFAAAAALLENNVSDLIVLEASDRIGGRIHSVPFGGVTIELGAEFCVGEVGNAVHELAGPHGLLISYKPFIQPDMHILANTSGYIFDTDRVIMLVDKSYAILSDDNIKHFNGTVGEYFYPRLEELLRTNNVEPELGEAIRFLVPQLECVDSAVSSLDDLGAWGFTEYWHNEGNSFLKWKTGGYKTIFDLMSNTFFNTTDEIPVKSKVLLNKQMTKLERKEEGVEVKVADGSTYIAEHVIITVPLGVLKKQAVDMFHPPLGELRSSAIKTLGFGCLIKIFIVFKERWWPTNKNVIMPIISVKERKDFIAHSVHGYWSSNITLFQPIINHNRMFMVLFAGDSAHFVETLTDEQVIDGLTELLDKLLGKSMNVTRPESLMRSSWCTNPLTQGTYSFRSLASDKRNISNNDLQQPILDGNNKPVILFGGEATSQHSYGTVHGAIATGRREATTIIDYLKNNPKLK